MKRWDHDSTRARIAVVSAALIAALAPAAPAAAADPVDVIFESTGSEQSWVVPEGVTSIHIVLIGGHGGNHDPSGYGHVVTGDLDVAAGTTLFVEVGGNGANAGGSGGAGGFNGGGAGGAPGTGTSGGAGGGGASDVRTVDRGSAGSLQSRLVVAGGGGGRAGNYTQGGAPGTAGLAGFAGQPIDGFGTPGTGGGAGTTTAGGLAGTGGTGTTSGSSGTGGRGGNGVSADGGGGGGGGYYGGGGGGGSTSDGYAGGGGGGSSFLGQAQNTSVEQDWSGVPRVTITYTPGNDPDPTPDPTGAGTGVVDADVTVPSSAACIELSETDVSFGTQRFGTDHVAADPIIVVTNCSGVTANLFARGTDATGNGATWNLVNDATTCAAGTRATDDFHLKLSIPARPDTPISLTESNTVLPYQLGGGLSDEYQPLLDMPCPGSSGAGQTMSMQIVFVVTEAE